MTFTANKLEVALRFLQDASDNLSDYSSATGDDRALRASALVMQIHNALIYNTAFPTAGRALAFDIAVTNFEMRA